MLFIENSLRRIFYCQQLVVFNCRSEIKNLSFALQAQYIICMIFCRGWLAGQLPAMESLSNEEQLIKMGTAKFTHQPIDDALNLCLKTI